MNTEKIEKIRSRLDAEAAKADKNIPPLLVTEVKRQLIDFCEQSDSFADTLDSTDKTYDQCLKTVAEGARMGISDIEAYTRAVKFYMPDANVECSMSIKTSASNVIKVNFLDLI